VWDEGEERIMSIGEGDEIGELIISFVHETKTTDLTSCSSQICRQRGDFI
jgi:hypothetical protein